jgi:chromosome segregation ATPase
MIDDYINSSNEQTDKICKIFNHLITRNNELLSKLNNLENTLSQTSDRMSIIEKNIEEEKKTMEDITNRLNNISKLITKREEYENNMCDSCRNICPSVQDYVKIRASYSYNNYNIHNDLYKKLCNNCATNNENYMYTFQKIIS